MRQARDQEVPLHQEHGLDLPADLPEGVLEVGLQRRRIPPARSMPDAPARTVVHMDKIEVPAVHMPKPNHRRQRGPPDPNQTIASFAVNTVRLAGFIPRKRQPLP
ncbi:MAG: hypothetical protein OXC26_02720 [Albidovulum sp.]|nr:hypothetical protein [Albidovulum sp.]